MGYSLTYRLDANDYTLITKREARSLVLVGRLLMAMGVAPWIQMWRR